MSAPRQHFIVLFGPLAVGKMTVGYAVAARTGFKVFHNHMTIELLLPFFEYGTPAFWRLLGELRQRILGEIAQSACPGLIFTYAWALNDPGDKAFIDQCCELFRQQGWAIHFVELEADQAERLKRNTTEFRLSQKPSKRDLAWSRENLLDLDRRYTLNSRDDFYYPASHCKLITNHLSADAAADQIVAALGLPAAQPPATQGAPMDADPPIMSGLPIMFFAQQSDWAAWLAENHTATAGLWLKIAKKGAGLESVSYAEALDVALCYGWIDGQKKSFDATSWLQKFTPRRARSIWSKVNCAHVQRLIERGQMQPAGMAAIEAAKNDGRWEAAYDSPSTATVPPDFQAALDANPPASAFYATLNAANRYAMLFRIQTAKQPATRARRIEQLIQMLERQEKLH